MNYEHIKRSGDLIVATIAIVFLVPLFVITAIIIKLDSRGPVIFRQKRYGKDKKIFIVYKFRSMSSHAPSDLPTNEFRDSHSYITRVGRVMRKLSIDELPQLINVIRGDMSLVGPRPVVLTEKKLVHKRDKYGANAVKPGITGWAQVNGRDELNDIIKARMDGYYVANFGPIIDIKCILKTASAILCAKDNVESSERDSQQEVAD